MSAIVEKRVEEIKAAMEAFEIENPTVTILQGVKSDPEGNAGSDALVHIPAGGRSIPVKAAGLLKGFGIKSLTEMTETGQYLIFKVVAAKRAPRKGNVGGEAEGGKDAKKK